jgi:ribosomal protein L11 methyltransferase
MGAEPGRPASKQAAFWVEAVFSAPLAQERRALARAMRQAGAAWVWEQGRQVRGLWPDTAGTRQAIESLASPGGAPPTVEAFVAHDPRARWAVPPLARLHPRLSLAEAWCGVSAGPDTLVIDPLTAFGAGDHPSTRLNLILLAELLSQSPPPAGIKPGAWAVDVGAGTGVLALAMALLAGFKVLAVDPDPASARAVRRNQALNPLAGPRVHFVRGYHEVLAGSFPLIAANLPGPILDLAAPRLAACLAPGGSLVASGFRQEYAPGLRERLAARGLTPAARAGQDGWEGIVFSCAG